MIYIQLFFLDFYEYIYLVHNLDFSYLKDYFNYKLLNYSNVSNNA